jgi:N6-adenosine-specific RNA methylase IME4
MKCKPFPDKKYNVIYADPPWHYGSWGKPSKKSQASKGVQNIVIPMPYPTMSICEISALPVNSIADINCELYLWTTQKYLPHVFGVMQAWGFRYCQTLTWCKKARGTGQGGVFCPTTEFLLLGRKGKMPKVKRFNTTWFLTKRPHNAHSKKPHFFRQLIEGLSVSPRIELFARTKTEGWDVWGNEV